MSDIMLFGVLRMPYDMAMSSELSRVQFYSRAQEAADRVESLEVEVNRLRVDLETAVKEVWRANSELSAFKVAAPAAGTEKDAERETTK